MRQFCIDQQTLDRKRTSARSYEKGDYHRIYLTSNKPEDLPYSEEIRLAKRAIGGLNILEDRDYTLVIPVALVLSEENEKGALLDADRSLGEEVGHLRRWTVYPKALLTSLLLSLDTIGKGEWKKAKESIANIRLFIHERNEGWLNYLKFRACWQRVMEEIRREGISEILKECWV